MRWSIEGQTPEFLAVTRMISLCDDIAQSIVEHVGLAPGMNVLDVGCGSGEFAFRLGAQLEGVRFTGIDLDERFVDFASRRARREVGYPFETPNDANEYRFICADGCVLPFEDGSFDAVVSHTYLTAVPNWKSALCEMRRVCKPRGVVASVTSMTDDFYGTGTIELFSVPLEREDSLLFERVLEAKNRTFGMMDITAGIAPRMVPSSFAAVGLKGVRCVPLAHYFCLSDAGLSKRDYLRYAELLRAVEEEQVERLGEALSQRDREAYEQLVDRRCRELISSAGLNREWNWYGNASLLVYGSNGLSRIL